MDVPSSIRVLEIRCGYRIDPLGISDPEPRLSWMLEADGFSRRQTAYRLGSGQYCLLVLR